MGVPIGQWLDGVKFNVTCPACEKAFAITIGFLRRNKGIITPCRNCGAGIKLDSNAMLQETDSYLNTFARNLKQGRKTITPKFTSKLGVSLVNADGNGEEKRDGEFPFDYSVYDDTLNFMADAMQKDANGVIAKQLKQLIEKGTRKSLINATAIFISLVKRRGRWDYKDTLRKRGRLIKAKKKNGDLLLLTPIRGDSEYLYFFDIWGNIHFGFVGLASGFNDDFLLAGSRLNDLATFGEEILEDVIEGEVGVEDIPSEIGEAIISSNNDKLSVDIGLELGRGGNFSLNPSKLHSEIFNKRTKWDENVVRFRPDDLDFEVN